MAQSSAEHAPLADRRDDIGEILRFADQDGAFRAGARSPDGTIDEMHQLARARLAELGQTVAS